MEDMKLLFFIFGCLFLGVTVASAQYQDYSRMGKTPAELKFIDDPLEIERKEPSWWFWNRPEKDSAADQLTYAAELERAGKVSQAIEAYDELVHEWHATQEALYAQLAIARLESARGRAQAAYNADIYLLAYFSGLFTAGPVLEDAVAQADFIVEEERQRSIKLRMGSGLRANYERIIHFAPRWERVPDLLMKIANLYMEDGEYASAITVFDRLIVDWPQYERLDEVVWTYCEACRKMADAWARDTGRLKLLERLLAGALVFRPMHPGREQITQWKQEVMALRRVEAYKKACFYDNPKAYDPMAALLAYQAFLQEFPEAPEAPRVRARISALSAEVYGDEKEATR